MSSKKRKGSKKPFQRIKGLVQKKQGIREKRRLAKLQAKYDANAITSNKDRFKLLVDQLCDKSIGVEVGDKKYHGKTYKSVCLGSDLVSWLVSSDYALTRNDAVKLGNVLMEKGVFEHVSGKKPLSDGDLFYRFREVTLEKVSEPFEDQDKKAEWKRRRGTEEETEFVWDLINPDYSTITMDKLSKTEYTIYFDYMPLVLGYVSNYANSGLPFNQFSDILRRVIPKITQHRIGKTRLLTLLGNEEYQKFWHFDLLFHSGAYMNEEDRSKIWELFQTGDFTGFDTKCWTQMSAVEIIAEVARAMYAKMESDDNEPRTIGEINGLQMVDAVDIQSKDLYNTTFNQVANMDQKTILATLQIQHPLVDGYEINQPTRVTVEKVFTSNARPVLLSFKQIKNGVTFEQGDSPWVEVSPRVIWKQGDNLLQDMGVEQAFKVFNIIWRKDPKFAKVKRRPWCHNYQVFPTGDKLGFMELVDNAEPFKNFDWDEWVERSNEDMHWRLITSAAGAYIAGYVLGVRDRHWDNIMIRNKHTLLHIDFGFLLGTQPPIDAPIFSISYAMKAALQAIGKWDKFVSLTLNAFESLRENADKVIHAAKMIFGPALEWEHSVIEEYIKNSLLVTMDKKKARLNIKDQLTQSSTAWQNWFKQISHKRVDPVWYGLLNKHFPPAEKIMNRVEEKSEAKMAAKKDKSKKGESLKLLDIKDH